MEILKTFEGSVHAKALSPDTKVTKHLFRSKNK